MNGHHSIKVIKRADREGPGPEAAAGATAAPSAREQARAMAAAVREWISESVETRQALYRETRRQLGWPEDEVQDDVS